MLADQPQTTRAPETPIIGTALLAFLVLCTMTASCMDDCQATSYAYEVATCRTSGSLAITAPLDFNITCPPALAWGGVTDKLTLSMVPGCTSDDAFSVSVGLAGMTGTGTFAFDATHIWAYFEASGDPTYGKRVYSMTATPQSLSFTSGSIVVQSRIDYGIEADLSLQLETSPGGRIAIVGHFVGDSCSTETKTGCSD